MIAADLRQGQWLVIIGLPEKVYRFIGRRKGRTKWRVIVRAHDWNDRYLQDDTHVLVVREPRRVRRRGGCSPRRPSA